MKSHKFTDKHPVAGSILIGIVLMFLPQILAQVPIYILRMAAGGSVSLAEILITVLVAALMLFAYKWWFRPDFKGPLTGNLGQGLLLSLPLIAYWGGSLILDLVNGSFSFKGVTPTILSTSIAAGAFEELAFRYGTAGTLLRKWESREKILSPVLISSVVFGLVHGLNIIVGADPAHTVIQAVCGTFIGVFLCAVYVRCGSIFPCMIAHAAHDIFAIAAGSSVEENGVITGGISWLNFADLAMCAVLAAVGLTYIGAKYRDEIIALWDDIWSRKRPAEGQGA